MARGSLDRPLSRVKDQPRHARVRSPRLLTDRWSVRTTPCTRAVGSYPGKSAVPISVVETVRLNRETS